MAYRCRSCSESFQRKTMLDRHGCSSEEFGKSHSCSDCGESSNATSVLSKHDCKHKNSDTEDKPTLMKCTYCKARFTNENTLKVHMRVHTGDLPYKCKECGAKFPYHSNLRSHLRIHDDPVDRPHKCDECGAKFSQITNLEAHLRTHGPDRTTTCNKCLCIIPENCTHICKQETGECFYVCKECNARFTVKNTLEVHMRTHTGEKPYRCTHCGERFSQTGALHSHMRTHTARLTHECGECSQRFRTEDELREHVRTHDQFILHKCKICFGAFANEKRLLLHMRQKHAQDEDMSQCDRCSRSFSTGSELQTHIREMHSEADSTHGHESEPDSTKHHCSKCSESFVAVSLLQSHQRCKHPVAGSSYLNAEHKCEDCFCKFTTQNRLIAHRRTKHPERIKPMRKTEPNATITSAESEPLQLNALAAENKPNKAELPSVRECSHLMPTESASSESLNKRGARITQKRKQTCDRFQCKECEEIFDTQHLLRVHEQGHKYERECNKCVGISCSCKADVSSAGKRGRKSRTYKCEACKCKFVERCQLKEHKCKSRVSAKNVQKAARISCHDVTHAPSTSNIKTYKCPECRIVFSRKTLVQMHLVNVHKLASRECSACSKIIVQSCNVGNDNSSDKQFVCDICRNVEDEMEVDSTTNNDFEGESSSEDSDTEDKAALESDGSDEAEETSMETDGKLAESTSGVAAFKDSSKRLRSGKNKSLKKRNEETKTCLLLPKNEQLASGCEEVDIEVDEKLEHCDVVVDGGNGTKVSGECLSNGVGSILKNKVGNYSGVDLDSDGDDTEKVEIINVKSAVHTGRIRDVCGMDEATNTECNDDVNRDALEAASATLKKQGHKADSCKEFTEEAALPSKQSSLTNLVPKLVNVLVGNSKLEDFGWPAITVVELLERVIRHCGEVPASVAGTTEDKLSENCKILFVASIGKDETASLLAEKSVEDIIVEVITLSEKDSIGET